MIIIAGYTRTESEKRDASVAAFANMVRKAREQDGCLDFAISADAADPARTNIFERWRDQESLNAWRKIARGPRTKPKEVHVHLYRTGKAEKPF